jgi:lipopolysaccharide/colanic/teichoic acid biosynthesis glycosyltransferase
MRVTGLSVSDLHEETAYVAVNDRDVGRRASDVALSSPPHGQNAGLRSQLAVKRGLDIAVSLTALITLLPLMLVVALLIRLDSPGPALFTQVRWGKDRRRINVYKFRSMRTDLGDATGVAQTVRDDPRITRIGAVIRKTNIDELPQLLNVLKGDMSLVGPRCHAIGMLAAGIPYEELVPAYHRRHLVKPGMTGLAQMRGLRGPTDRSGKARARIACDLHYIDNFSLLLDLRIIFGTILAEIRGGKGF